MLLLGTTRVTLCSPSIPTTPILILGLLANHSSFLSKGNVLTVMYSGNMALGALVQFNWVLTYKLKIQKEFKIHNVAVAVGQFAGLDDDAL